MSASKAARRLRKEMAALEKERPELIWTRQKESNVLLWSFLLAPPRDSVYGGGWYWGRLTFKSDYPFTPPSISMVTPSGRFRPETKICMSMSDFHPESWVPSWSVATILKGVLSFMLGDEQTTGSVSSTDADKRALAALSVEWNKRQPEFCGLFPDFDDIRRTELARETAAVKAAADKDKDDGREDKDKDDGREDGRREAASFEVLCARGDFDGAARLDPSAEKKVLEAKSLKLRGDAFFRGGDPAKALAAYDAAAATKVPCAALLRNRAAALERLGGRDFDVVRDCTAALDLDESLGEPPSKKALVRRADALHRQGRSHDAARDLARARRIPGDDHLAPRIDALAAKIDQPPPPPHEDNDAATTQINTPTTAPTPPPEGSSSDKKKKRRAKKKKKRTTATPAADPVDDDDDDDDDEPTPEDR